MNFIVVIPLTLLIVGLSLIKMKNMLAWFGVWWVSIFLFINFGMDPAIPVSIRREYMIIATMSLLIYNVSDKERWRQVKDPVLAFLRESRYLNALVATILVISAGAAAKTYLDSQVKIEAPLFGRTVHPAPPTEIDFKGKKIDLIKGENPFRKFETENPEEFKKHLAEGKDIYYKNCFYCHGDSMEGDGHYAFALDPIPTDFADPATIGMLQENFLFWRIAKGGIGMPMEGGPWASAMPAWEEFLTEDEIWKVILFLYDYTGYKPRAMEEHH